MQNAPQVNLFESANFDADSRQKEFAHRLAKKHGVEVVTIPVRKTIELSHLRKDVFLEPFHDWESTLGQAIGVFKSTPSNNLPVSRAGEWMLDNFYIVKQTFRQIEEDLPGSYLNQLPILNLAAMNGNFRPGLVSETPRIFALAQEWIEYNQSQIYLAQTIAFFQDYQDVAPLTIGELWAVPIMLRIGLLEQLVNAVSELTGIKIKRGESLLPNPDHSLSGNAAGDADLLEVELSRPAGETGLPIEAPDQFSPSKIDNESIVANCFLSLRLLASTDWKSFFESTSRTEQILRKDPAQIYASMDFDTRNSYRSVIEDLAFHSNSSEEQVALEAVELASRGEDNAQKSRAHVGYYLRDAGRTELEHSIHYRPGFAVRIQRFLRARPTATYLGSIAFFSFLFTFGLLVYAAISHGSPLQIILAGILGFGLAMEIGIALVQRIVTHRIKPQSLPRMDFSEGIPVGYGTMVVIPSLLESTAELNHLLQELELYYLSNSDPQLTYALLTDFADAPSQNMPEDEQLLASATAGIENLNKKYVETSPFYLFHRQREWNPSEEVWMGWERKRGKLAEFNRLLLNLGETSYSTQVGDLSILSDVKYVITLDADTSLPQGSANRLIATLAHPLNHAEFSEDGRSVVSGYTVLQPRVAIKPTSANRSLFSKIYTGIAGFDLYSFAVSDVYQDLFGEGSYVGKGIYDVAAFERSLAGQVRENTLLSHDLFEGISGRAALVTDIVLYEEYPSRYLVYTRRLSRWIRGDWQLLPWLFPMVRTENGLVPNRLSIINLWKVFDNLRRSLLVPNILAMLAAGWLFLPGSPLFWTLLVLLPSALPVIMQIIPRGQHNQNRLAINQILKPTLFPLIRWALSVFFLPFESLLILGAIRTTLARLLIGRKHLLQWTTAANVERSLELNLRSGTWREMFVSLVLTILLGTAVVVFKPGLVWLALPFLVAWLIAPHIAYEISQPVNYSPPPLSEDQHRQVLRLARRTWAFFEQFTGPTDHWLPPDHFQESPLGSVAHYTTPTNIGLYLVSSLAAYDLGYLGLFELVVRLRSTLDSMDGLEHYRGHLLNWYDSLTLTALPPRYVSTVDSGNLAACLITLKEGLNGLTDAPVLGDKEWQGLLVILDILSEILQKLEKNNPHASVESFEIELSEIYQRISAVQNQPDGWGDTLDWLSREGWARVSLRLMEMLKSHPNLQPATLSDVQLYLSLMQHHLQDMQRSMDLFMPWHDLLSSSNTSLPQTEAWQDFHKSLPAELPTLGGAEIVYEQVQTALIRFKELQKDEAIPEWCQKLDDGLSTARAAVKTMLIGLRDLAEQANTIATGMDFRFLFDERRQLFHIGYKLSAEQLDPSYYDLLESEARIASLVAIAKGDVPQSHWQHLGRPVTMVNGRQVLLSWSGTMFEYLMPTLFARNYPDTFLSDSSYVALSTHASYGRERHVPWGISESGFFAFDLNQNYQYRAFGVTDLGYKRELPSDLVIAPYASLLGLSLQPRLVMENAAQLEKLNMLGRFGFYEAIDYTQTRLPTGQAYAIVQSYMAHHQGMILLAACNYLAKDVMVERFHSDEHIRSIELLLQEKIPLNPPIEYPHPDEPLEFSPVIMHSNLSEPWRVPVDSLIPQVHILSQGNTSVLITNAGGGYSQWGDFALTRWRPDTTLDQWGTWIYIQDRDSGALWSAAYQPCGGVPERGVNTVSGQDQEVMFYQHKVEFQRSDNGINLHTGVTVSTEGVEIRRVNILNDSDRPRRLKLTSYGEVVLAAQTVDRRHPAFNKLFIESEYLPQENALLFERRPRSKDETPIVLIHAMVIEYGRKVTGEHESDRAKFLGRLRSTGLPALLQDGNRLAGTTRDIKEDPEGGTLDPIFSLGQEINLKPHAKTRVTFLTLAAPTRAEALEKLSHYQSGLAIYHAFEDAQIRCEHQLLEQGLDANMVENLQRLLSALLYPVGTLRAAPHILAQNQQGQSGLWGFGISGDYPIMLVQIRDGESTLLSEALQAYTYWRNHNVVVNLVILNEQDTGYSLDLHNTIYRLVTSMGASDWINQRDGIFLLRADQLQPADKILLETVAGVILDENNGTLAEHALRLIEQPIRLPEFTAALNGANESERTEPLQIPGGLLMDNGYGGFSPDGKEYVIHLQPGEHTPHPWINVIANPQFGFLVSEAGSSCTWAGNSGENRLTPWSNDPVTDMPGEALYLRDEGTGKVWSPTPMPAGAETVHVIHHGAGYSIFESQSHGLNQNLQLFSAPDAPVKIARLRLKNLWQRPRRITVTYYAEWVLGTTRDMQQAYIIPEFDPDRNALLASNRYNGEFSERVAFLAANKKPHGVTADRMEFLGRLGSLRAPAALRRIGLASAVNAGLDPCAAIQLHIDLAPDATEEVYFLIGEGESREDSLEIIGKIQAEAQVEATWQAVQKQWDEILNTITVETPDRSMDLMLNHWLLYQTLSCRLWGRTALYQSSGAFGFRDQLQDVLALLHTQPGLARAQILEAARHQFEAGDVLHWWNPPAGRGVRTRFSDDLLWLPFVTAEYVTATGDASILTENIPFLKGEVLKSSEMERYAQYEAATEAFSLYEHCRRALEKGATTGAHGLPLMGSGDWNDGMNQVGAEGRGESIWLGWFLNSTLIKFTQLASLMNEDPAPYKQKAEQYARALEDNAWDGEWYLRAFHDDGSRLGSHENTECRIDSIAQSWAVLSGAAQPDRAAQSMESVNRLLVKPADQMILLFTPPFDKTVHNPGYIMGYLPGIRENGGQYTHAAAWTAWAFAKLGQGERAVELFHMLNPTSHSDTPEKAARYKVEPYVIAADIYSMPPFTGYGGWSWYTGSAGWTYRLGIEAILGITREGNMLSIDPCIPPTWPGFKVDYRFGNSHYKIEVIQLPTSDNVGNPQNFNRDIRQILLDGIHVPDGRIPLNDDGQSHEVRLTMGQAR